MQRPRGRHVKNSGRIFPWMEWGLEKRWGQGGPQPGEKDLAFILNMTEPMGGGRGYFTPSFIEI